MNRIFYITLIMVWLASVCGSAGAAETAYDDMSITRPAIEWENTYGGVTVDWGRCVQQTSDGGYIVTGARDRNVYSPWNGFIYLFKTNSAGEMEWDRKYGIDFYENLGNCVQQTADGGYVIAGYLGTTYHIDAQVMKTDAEGDESWTSTMGTYEYYDNSTSVQQTMDGGYIVSGWTGSSGAGSSDAWLIKLEPDGDMEWERTFGGIALDGADCVQQTSDGGYILAGTTWSFSTGGTSDAWLIKTDGNGEETWNRVFGGTYEDTAKCVRQTQDGGYIMTGSTSSFGSGEDTDVWLIRTDAGGNEMWARSFGDDAWDQGKCVVQSTDGGFFITGDYTDPVHGDLEMYMIKTDADGNEEWNYIIDHEGETDSGSYGIQTADGGYIVTGETGEYMFFMVDVLLVKLEGVTDPTVAAGLSCVPAAGTVPFTSAIAVELTNRCGGQARRLAGRIDLDTAGGLHLGSWRAGWSNIAPDASRLFSWEQSIPALGSLIGNNAFTLVVEDVTPAPYNQPPYPPAGDTDTASCTVTGFAP